MFTRTPSKSRTHAYARNHSSTTRIPRPILMPTRVDQKVLRASADARPRAHPPRARATRPTRASPRHRTSHRAPQSPPLGIARRAPHDRQTDARRTEDQTTSTPWGADVIGCALFVYCLPIQNHIHVPRHAMVSRASSSLVVARRRFAARRSHQRLRRDVVIARRALGGVGAAPIATID